MNGFEDWATTIETCAILNRSEGWLRLHYREYGIERKRVGQSMMYRRDQVESLAERLREQDEIQ